MTTLTVGMLRRLLDSDSISDDTPICIEAGDEVAAVARRAFAQASDAVPIDLGGTDPATESTRAVLIITDEPGSPIWTTCVLCSQIIEPDGDTWRHADGHDYRHPARPGQQRPFWARWARLTQAERERVWDSFAARRPWRTDTGFDLMASLDVSDPATWHPDSPLYILLRMAAAGDFTPLADFLHDARTPDNDLP